MITEPGVKADDRPSKILDTYLNPQTDPIYEEAHRQGADCLIAGEITSKIANYISKRKQTEIEAYLPSTEFAAVGLSHAGSEFFVMKELAPFVERQLDVPAEAVPEPHWWR